MNTGTALVLVGLVQVLFGCIFFRQPGVSVTFLRVSRRANENLTLPGKLLLASGLLFGVVGATFDIIAGFR